MPPHVNGKGFNTEHTEGTEKSGRGIYPLRSGYLTPQPHLQYLERGCKQSEVKDGNGMPCLYRVIRPSAEA